MPFQILDRPLPGVVVLRPDAFADERGVFVEAFRADRFAEMGLPSAFVQENQSRSRKGVIRGLHFQWEPPMGKLVRCLHGGIIDVVVDVRHGSPTLGDHAAVELTDRNHQVIWVPPGFAHGTFALAEDTIVLYECTGAHGTGEGGIRWNDPALGIEWPAMPPIVSEKDEKAPLLSEWLADPRSQQFAV